MNRAIDLLWPAMGLAIGLAGCSTYPGRQSIARGPIEVRDTRTYPDYIRWLPCSQIIYLDQCGLEDEDGNALSEILADPGDRICFTNRSNCDIVIRFDTDLFGRSQPFVSLGPDESVNLSVNLETGGDYELEIICQCGAQEGDDSSNPTVRVGGGGDDDDDDDGG